MFFDNNFLVWLGFFLHLVIVLMSFFFGGIFFRKALNSDVKKARLFLYFITFFFLFMAISYIFRIILVFLIPPNMDTFLYELTVHRTELTQDFAVIYAFAVYVSMTTLCAGVEFSALKAKTKYLLSAIIIGSLLFIGFLLASELISYKYATFVQIIPMIISTTIIVLLSGVYFYLSLNNTGQIRKKSFLIGIGLLVLIGGIFLSSRGVFQSAFLNILEIPMLFSPSMIILSFGLLFSGYRL